MPIANMLSITSNPFLSMLIWIALLLAALYFARKPFHRTIGAACKIIHNAMRLSAASVLSAEKRLVRRNREVLISAGREKAERLVEREFGRVNTAVIRDLESFPHLQRQLTELTTRLDEDYHSSADLPPSLPNWLPVIESIANIEHSGDSMVANMLGEINRTLKEQHKSAIDNYRNSNAQRHSILNKMRPVWRKVQKGLGTVDKSIGDLIKRAKRIDRCMEEYEQIRLQTDQAARMLFASSLTQFFIGGVFLTIAFGGALINFNLIALPMSAMVGVASHIGPYKTSEVAALFIILIQLTTGLFLMESLRITRLFPVIGGMDDKMRHMLGWITFALLTALAVVESALAFLSDQIAQNMETLRLTLSPGLDQNGIMTSMIPTVGQMIIGFILPFALAFVPIALESFIAASRTVLGIMAAGVLRTLAFVLRLIGNTGYYIGRLIVNLYDLIIFPSIWLEGVIAGPRAGSNPGPRDPLNEKGAITEQVPDNSSPEINYKDPQG
ncbi:hypothetical protein N9893_01735 [bacterium]|nr:hypothetical protein [bacterium]